MENKENERSDENIESKLKGVRKFAQPKMFGWSRIFVQKENEFVVRYDLSGHRFKNMKKIQQHLLETKSPLSIDCFSFDEEFESERVFKSFQNERILQKDISDELEALPIPIISDQFAYPKKFEYVTENILTDLIPSSLREPVRKVCCDCTDNCADKSSCRCWMFNIQRFIDYSGKNDVVDQKSFGYQYKRLFEAPPTGIFECHEGCKCKIQCSNRVAQQPISHQLDLFQNDDGDWSVRCRNDIPAGAFVCCYLGEVITFEEAKKIFRKYGGDSHLFVTTSPENPPTKKRMKRNNNNTAENPSNNQMVVIDAQNKGNIARFINHSCDPNMLVENVYVDTHDLRFPRIAFFARRLIEAGEELTIDFDYKVGSAPGHKLYCKCGTPKCRGRIL